MGINEIYTGREDFPYIKLDSSMMESIHHFKQEEFTNIIENNNSHWFSSITAQNLWKLCVTHPLEAIWEAFDNKDVNYDDDYADGGDDGCCCCAGDIADMGDI